MRFQEYSHCELFWRYMALSLYNSLNKWFEGSLLLTSFHGADVPVCVSEFAPFWSEAPAPSPDYCWDEARHNSSDVSSGLHRLTVDSKSFPRTMIQQDCLRNNSCGCPASVKVYEGSDYRMLRAIAGHLNFSPAIISVDSWNQVGRKSSNLI